MKKRMMVLAVASVMFGAGSAFAAAPAAEVSVNGFLDYIYTVSDEASDIPATSGGGNTTETQFNVSEAEVDLASKHLRMDLDTVHDTGIGVEQVYFTHEIMDGWNVMGGKFNNNITAESQDAPDMQFTNASLLYHYGLVDSDATNLTGVAVSGMAGPANVMVSITNDPSNNSTAFVNNGDPTDPQNSINLLVSGSPMEGLNLEFGFMGQDAGLGDLIDINGTYMISNFTVGVDYLAAGDAGSTTVQTDFSNGMSVWAGYNFGNGFGVKARYEMVSFDDSDIADDETVTELFATYAVSDALSINLDIADDDEGSTGDKFSKTLIEAVALF